MSKPRKQRTSASGKFVSPLLNELEWLDDEAEEPARTDGKPKSRRGKSSYNRQLPAKTNKKKAAASAAIGWTGGMEAVAAKNGRRPAPPAPLLLIEKPKSRYPRKSWFEELIGTEPWMQGHAGKFADALQSFQLGLDGIMKSGEELRIIAPQRTPVVIDVAPEDVAEVPFVIETEPWNAGIRQAQSGEPPQEQRAEQEEDSASAASAQDVPDSYATRLHQYGLASFRLGPFDQWVDIDVAFDRPFADDGYALVATTNEPGCRSVIIDKASHGAVVRLLRDSLEPQLSGELNWIALGDR